MRLTKKLIYHLGLVVFLTLSGCGTSTNLESVVLSEFSGSKRDYAQSFHNAINVGEVVGEKKARGMRNCRLELTVLKKDFRKTLSQEGLLANNPDAIYTISIRIIDIDQPSMGTNMTVHTKFRYSLKDRKRGKKLIDRIIRASHTTKMGEAFSGAKRVCMATERSVEKNLEKFLTEVSNLKGDEGNDVIY